MKKSKDAKNTTYRILFNPSKIVKYVAMFAFIFIFFFSYLYITYKENYSGSSEIKERTIDDPCGLEKDFRLFKRSEEEKKAFMLFCEYEEVQEALKEGKGIPYYYRGGGNGKYRFLLTSRDPDTIYEVDIVTEIITPKPLFIEDFETFNSDKPNIINIPNTEIFLPIPSKYPVIVDTDPLGSAITIESSVPTKEVRSCMGNPGWGTPDKMETIYCQHIVKELEGKGIEVDDVLEEETSVIITTDYSQLDAEEWTKENLLFQGQTLGELIEEGLKYGKDESGEYISLGDKLFYTKSRRCCLADDFVYVYSTKDVNDQDIVIQFLSKEGKSQILEDILVDMEDR